MVTTQKKRKTISSGGRGETNRRRFDKGHESLEEALPSDADTTSNSFIARNSSEAEPDELNEDSDLDQESSSEDGGTSTNANHVKSQKNRTREPTPSRESDQSGSDESVTGAELNRGDGDPFTFSDDTQTEIPAFREWCKDLTVASRERTAKSFLEATKIFVRSVLSYVGGLEGALKAECDALRRRWQTPSLGSSKCDSSEDDPYAWIRRNDRKDLSPAKDRAKSLKDSQSNSIGTYARLCSQFGVLAEDTVDDLKTNIEAALESKCEEGMVLVRCICLLST